jgi:hypothetical protein
VYHVFLGDSPHFSRLISIMCAYPLGLDVVASMDHLLITQQVRVVLSLPLCITPSPTHSTHPHTHSPTHPLTHSLTHSLQHDPHCRWQTLYL